MKWFKHDSNAHGDAKLKKLRQRFGIVGYGLYWYCVELVAGTIEKSNIKFELEEDAETIAVDWNLDQIKVQEIMQYMIELNLFENQSGRITCLKLAKRLDDTNAKNPEIRQILKEINRNNSEMLGETPNNSESLRAEEIRLDKNIKHSYDRDVSQSPDSCPYQKIVNLYHQTLPELPCVVKLTDKRKSWLKARWRESIEHQDLEFWKKYFSYVRESDFLLGRPENGTTKRAWQADFEWLINSSNFVKVLEGKYHA